MMYTHVAVAESASRRNRVELSAYDLAGDEEYPHKGKRGGQYKLVNGRKVYKPGGGGASPAAGGKQAAQVTKGGGKGARTAQPAAKPTRVVRAKPAKTASRGPKKSQQQEAKPAGRESRSGDSQTVQTMLEAIGEGLSPEEQRDALLQLSDLVEDMPHVEHRSGNGKPGRMKGQVAASFLLRAAAEKGYEVWAGKDGTITIDNGSGVREHLKLPL